MLFKNSVRTSKRTPYFTITRINWLTLFKFKDLRFYISSQSAHVGGGGYEDDIIGLDSRPCWVVEQCNAGSDVVSDE
jgi:hypothetical protein